MRKKLIATLVIALAIPSAALASKPSPPPGKSGDPHGKAQPKMVLYVLKGTLSAYTAATSGGNGSVTITITKANHYGSLLSANTPAVTFANVTMKTKVVLNGTFASGDLGVVKVRAPKTFAGATTQTVTAALQAQPSLFQIIDQGQPGQ